MKILQAYKFQLKTKPAQESLMRQFAGCCRFLYNYALALEKETYEQTGKRLGYNKLAGFLKEWKHQEETEFLAEVHSQILQQSLKDLDQAYKNFFASRAAFPKFKKKGRHDSFRYPQGFKVDEGNSRVYLPKIGWVLYRKSRKIEGRPKNITISLSAGKWYVSIQTEREIEQPVHPSQSAIGIDMGIASFATLSDGTNIMPLNSFRKHEATLRRFQQKLSKKKKFSKNWYKLVSKIQKLHKKIADARKDFLHKSTTAISKNHAIVVMEDLKVSNMSASASGTLDSPGKNVKAKSGLNKSILDQGWFEFRRQLDYKLSWRGGKLILVNPQYTSQTCSRCGFVSSENRKTQACFKCCKCGFEANADHNAAINILAAGHAASACWSGKGSSARVESGTSLSGCGYIQLQPPIGSPRL